MMELYLLMRFNSTLVQLKVTGRCFLIPDLFSFNSTLVQLKGI